ncbi:uncharacterized protein LOC123553387 isoform X1 [Mercenaria mercenaria]|uniref:uncharacterized protein LOC123553387 isoform X1 n=1 Tax=Mercenaria mercenaria TaxID=6596 RepID=UPI00234F9110|nr:uncharacterized protein LOC123553387 isoform X1 [Mercenaria mercenaria]
MSKFYNAIVFTKDLLNIFISQDTDWQKMMFLLFCFLCFLSPYSGFLILPDTSNGYKLPGYSSLLPGGNYSLTNLYANYLQTVGDSYKLLGSLLSGGNLGTSNSGGGGLSSLPGMNLLNGGNNLPGMGSLTGSSGGTAAKLEQYNVDRRQISVSGISAGGAMATQIHVIFSKDIMGVGLIAGLPFGCSSGNMMTAVTTCMTMPSGVSAASLESRTETEADHGEIDAVTNMANDKVYILNGRADTTVNPGIGPVIESYYEHFVSDRRNVKTNFDINSQHCMPTDNYGVKCSLSAAGSHYISNCNFSAAYHLLNHIYGGHLKMPTTEEHANGKLLKFSQSEFFPSSSHGSMDTTGYIYVPSGCMDKATECKLHVAFHGCLQGQDSIGDVFVRHSGYNEVGELNNIIILYPQAVKSTMNPMNPNGCWDWWGYTGQTFDKKSGFQPTAIKTMIDRITG